MKQFFPYKIILFIVFLLHCGIATSQNTDYSGKVYDEKTTKPIEGVLVLLKKEGKNNVEKFTQTSSEGIFKISFNSKIENYYLEFSMLGYQSYKLNVSDYIQGMSIYLKEKSVQLKEVIIKAPKIRQRGDTITYTVASFAKEQDKTIGDVLKNMPGIEVEESGAIKYNGVAINKFYIEGLDLLEGRYGIATNGIAQKDVSRVEILENHQPIKALEDFSFSDNAAINIKLKEGAKSKWIGTATLGSGGSPFLWNAEVQAMRFAIGSQSISTYKTNNIGKDIVGETKSFDLESVSESDNRYDAYKYLELEPNTTNQIGKHRLRFNNTHALSSTHLWKLNEDYELKGQIVYINNKNDYNSFAKTDYFLSGDTISMTEQENSVIYQNKIDLGAILTANTKKYYLKNKLESKINWNTTHINLLGTHSIAEKAKLPNFFISNNFELVKKIGQQAISIKSYNKFFNQDNSLRVIRGDTSISQNVNLSGFFSSTEAYYSFNFNDFTFSAISGFSILSRKLATNLFSNLPTILSEQNNNNKFLFLHPYLKSSLEYKTKSLKAKLTIPLYFYYYSYDELSGQNKKYFISPKLYLNYYLSSQFSISLNGTYNENPAKEYLFYSGYILQNYRKLQEGINVFSYDKSKSVSLGIQYKNPIQMLFANASLFKGWNTTPKIIKRDFIQNYLFYSYLLRTNKNDIWQANARISKGLDFLNGLFSLSAMYLSTESQMYQQNTLMPYTSKYFMITPNISIQLTDWLNSEYRFTYEKSTFDATRQNLKIKTAQIKQELNFNIIPTKRMRINLSGEYYKNEITEDNTKDIFLMDAAAFYTLKNRWELSLSITNIFNEKEYAYQVTNNLSAVYSNHQIRSRNILLSLYFKL